MTIWSLKYHTFCAACPYKKTLFARAPAVFLAGLLLAACSKPALTEEPVRAVKLMTVTLVVATVLTLLRLPATYAAWYRVQRDAASAG